MTEQVFGMPLVPLPEGVTALECILSIKALDEEGNVRLFERTSDGLTGWEALGMAHTLTDSLAANLIRRDETDDGD